MPADYGAVPAACALNGSRFMGREIAVATSTPLNKDTGAGTGQWDISFYCNTMQFYAILLRIYLAGPRFER